MVNDAVNAAETEGHGTRGELSEWAAKGYCSHSEMIFKEVLTGYFQWLYFAAYRGFISDNERQQIAAIEDALRKIKAAAKKSKRAGR